MVVWVYAGGGETEIAGLIKFFQRNFPNITFERKLPFGKKPGPKPRKIEHSKPKTLGITNSNLIAKIKELLPIAIKDSERTNTPKPSLILVVDDLDCRNLDEQHLKFTQCFQQIPEASDFKNYILFASPEIEAWMIADWDNTFAKHQDFKSRNRHREMQHWLSTHHNFPFDQPETFGSYDEKRDCCDKKLSELLIQASKHCARPDDKEYKKSIHSAELLLEIKINNILEKCPNIRRFYYYMVNLDL